MPSGYIVGVGAANVDVCGRSRKPFIMHDSNPGFLSSSCGGVTRNVCENLARLGARVYLISAVGDDVYAEKIRADSLAAGIDISRLYTVSGHASSAYISLHADDGDMLVAMSDMSVLKSLPPSYLDENLDLIRGASLVTCDPSLPADTIVHLLDLCDGSVPVYVDPVSTSYASVVEPYIGRFDTAKPNLMELEILSGRAVSCRSDILSACEAVLSRGLRRIFVSLGKDGCLYMDRSGTVIERKLRPLDKMVNATGGGDSFMAAVEYCTLCGLSTPETIDYALAAGLGAVMSATTISPEMSVSLLENILKEYQP